MSKERHYEVPVLIVGAGPAGLTAAVALARAGIESLLVERRPGLSDLPRATFVSSRSMELLRSWGLEEEIRAGGVDVECLMWNCETLATASAGSVQGYPSREQSAVFSPTGPACVPQDHLEPVLLRQLASLGTARVRFGTAVDGVELRPDGVRAVLRDVAGGEESVVSARYLVAADGVYSTVRNALGIPMRGPDRLAEAVAALFRAPLWELVGDLRYGIYNPTHPDAGSILLPAGAGDRWIYGRLLEPGEADPAELTGERITRAIRLGAGVSTLQPRIERIGAFSFAAQVADSFRRGNAFLIGDAAHRATPRGGTGLNSAIHDGYDLGWKLGWVLNGWAEPELLDSYEAERRPVAEYNVTRSAEPDGSWREIERQVHVDLGGRIAHVWLPSDAGRVSTLDLLGPGLTLFAAAHGPGASAAAAVPRALPLQVRRLDAMTARALGIQGDGALLVRPDGVAVRSELVGLSLPLAA